jgi:hypothetical protein
LFDNSLDISPFRKEKGEKERKRDRLFMFFVVELKLRPTTKKNGKVKPAHTYAGKDIN